MTTADISRLPLLHSGTSKGAAISEARRHRDAGRPCKVYRVEQTFTIPGVGFEGHEVRYEVRGNGPSRHVQRLSNEAITDDIDAGHLIKFATQWASLGDAVTDQVVQVVENPENEDVNPAAIRLASERLQGFSEEIDDAFAIYFECLSENGDES